MDLNYKILLGNIEVLIFIWAALYPIKLKRINTSLISVAISIFSTTFVFIFIPIIAPLTTLIVISFAQYLSGNENILLILKYSVTIILSSLIINTFFTMLYYIGLSDIIHIYTNISLMLIFEFLVLFLSKEKTYAYCMVGRKQNNQKPQRTKERKGN